MRLYINKQRNSFFVLLKSDGIKKSSSFTKMKYLQNLFLYLYFISTLSYYDHNSQSSCIIISKRKKKKKSNIDKKMNEKHFRSKSREE